ncbi:hypothetical protein [Caudoviricetes sp.]|nr:hypothetical protein [Caudoviricetes sp.]
MATPCHDVPTPSNQVPSPDLTLYGEDVDHLWSLMGSPLAFARSVRNLLEVRIKETLTTARGIIARLEKALGETQAERDRLRSSLQDTLATVRKLEEQTQNIFVKPTPTSIIVRGKTFTYRLYPGCFSTELRFFGPISVTGDHTAREVLTFNGITNPTPAEIAAVESLRQPTRPDPRIAELEKRVESQRKIIESQQNVDRLHRDVVAEYQRRIADLEETNRTLSIRTRGEWQADQDVIHCKVSVDGRLIAQARGKGVLLDEIVHRVRCDFARYLNR